MPGFYILHGGRGSGKTAQSIAWLREHPEGVMIVHDEATRQRVLRDLNTAFPRPYTSKTEAEAHVITLGSLGRLRGRWRKHPPVIVDNLELVLGNLLAEYGLQLDSATTSADVRWLPNPLPPRD